MDDLKPSILMGKLKQLLPHGVSPNNDLFLSVFLTRLLPSMREAVGSGDHKTAAAMVRATDALWDARGSHDPTVVVARPISAEAQLLLREKRTITGVVAPFKKSSFSLSRFLQFSKPRQCRV
jgi:hypothetical protein